MCIRVSPDGSQKFHSVITPAASLTGPRCKNSGSAHIVLQTYGTKLVMWWDCSAEVIKEYEKIHCTQKEDRNCLSAVLHWPGLHWAILEVGDYVVIEPGQVHAVLSPVNSALSGWSFVASKWLRDGILKERMEWEMDLVEKRMEGTNYEKYGNPFMKGGPVDAMEDDIDLLDKWFEKGGLKEEEKELLKELAEDMRERLDKVKNMRQKKKGKVR